MLTQIGRIELSVVKRILLPLICGLMPVSVANAEDQQSSTEIPSPADEGADVTDYAIFDLEMGTPARTAERILEKRGYTLREQDLEPSWYAIVGKQTRTSIEKRFRISTSSSHFDGPNGETIGLEFEQTPRGALLSRSRLELPADVPTDILKAAFESKFGQPNCRWGWCHETFAADDHKREGLSVRLIADPQNRTILVDSADPFARIVERSISSAVKDCKAARLGVPVRAGFFFFAC